MIVYYRDHAYCQAVSEITLYSSLSDLVTVFEFSMLLSIQFPQSISDPYVVPIGCTKIDSVAFRSASDGSQPKIDKRKLSMLLIHSAPYTVLETAEPSEKGSVLMDSGVCFRQIFVLYDDLSISETLYAVIEQGQELKGPFLPQRSLQDRTKTSTWMTEGGFIVENNLAIDSEQNSVPFVLSRRDRSTSSLSSSNQNPVLRTVDFEWLADKIGNDNPHGKAQIVSAEDFVGRLHSSLNCLILKKPGIQSL